MKPDNMMWVISIAFFILLMGSNSCSKKNEPISYQIERDNDGNFFKTVTIGTQVWMAENLKSTKYRNGDPIPNMGDEATWRSQYLQDNIAIGGYCWYNDGTGYKKSYGGFYNWYAVNDSRQIAPPGWHVPTDVEWTTLENYLITNGYNYDGTKTEDKIAKAMASTTDWLASTNPGSIGNSDYPVVRNKSGFTAIPGGYRNYDGAFLNVGISDDWWSTTADTAGVAWFRNLYNSYSDLYRDTYPKSAGFSVRCIRD